MKLFASLSALLLAVLVAWSGPAAAVDDVKPVFENCGKFGKDSDSDQADTSGAAIPEAEIVNAFIKHDPAKGAEATTINLTIKSLTGAVPAPATSITYNAVYGGVAPETTTFVRAHIDFSGTVVYEYGHLEDLAVSTRYAYDGDTVGKLFTGDNGVVQIVVPAEAGGKAGSKLTGIIAQTQVGRTTVVPGAINQSPTRGLSFQNDEASIGSYTVEPCTVARPATGPVTTAPTTPPPSVQGPAPTVKLLTKSVKKARKGKKVTFKLSTSSPLKSVALRLAKGRKVFGTGRAASLSGTKTLKVKLSKALGKGTYQLAFAGTDASGRRAVGTFKVKVR